MLRRLTASLVLWLGLVGVGLPVFACAAAAGPYEDCCPQGVPSPCTNSETAHDFATATLCCVAAPAPSQAVSVDAGRSAPERELDSGSPDAIALPAWMDCSTGAGLPEVRAPQVSASRTNAAQTYLRTGRLRL